MEGESELVAGYHVEIGGGYFALIALGEYGRIVAIRVFTSVLFLRCNLFVPMVISFRMFFVLVRAAVPRYRYDVLMDFCWKMVLPLSLRLFCLIVLFGGC